MILSSAVLTLGAIGTNALSGTRLHRHYEVAASLIDKQLSLIDYMGIDQFIQMGQTEGIVEELEPGYRWSVTTEYQGVDNLYLVAITVSWLEGAKAVPRDRPDDAGRHRHGYRHDTSTGTQNGGAAEAL